MSRRCGRRSMRHGAKCFTASKPIAPRAIASRTAGATSSARNTSISRRLHELALALLPNVSAGKIELDDLKYAIFDPRELAKLRLQYGNELAVRSNGGANLVG